MLARRCLSALLLSTACPIVASKGFSSSGIRGGGYFRDRTYGRYRSEGLQPAQVRLKRRGTHQTTAAPRRAGGASSGVCERGVAL